VQLFEFLGDGRKDGGWDGSGMSHARLAILPSLKAIEDAQRLKTDVVLNVSMPILNGLDADHKIRTELPKIAIVILSSYADTRFVEEAKKIGARAYVAKTKAARLWSRP
jgi:DNA-binding NarL/FixJ family response regulator